MTQQAFLIAAERLDAIKTGSERAFLFGTALRLARTAARVNRRWLLQDDLDQRTQAPTDVEALADQHRATELLDRVLGSMPENLVTVFVLFELEGLSAPEVAQVVGIPVGTVASRLRRAREVFRAGVTALRNRSLRRPSQ
jgi:RNA polymerase sigma-70 factor (ECF subfamily)